MVRKFIIDRIIIPYFHNLALFCKVLAIGENSFGVDHAKLNKTNILTNNQFIRVYPYEVGGISNLFKGV